MSEAYSERVIEMVRLLGMADDYNDPNPERSHITGLDHALRLASLLEYRTQDPLLAFAGLVHDLARPLNDVFHGEIVAEIVRDRVPSYIYHVLRTHGQYQEAIMHHLPQPVQPPEVVEECKPFNLQKLALMFAACEALTFSPEYLQENETTWTYAGARQMIIDILN
jgi:hypothetical protein